ncbi:glucose-1-phosphate adenylyltransferase [candidate division CSSED10-310 bacterium]|uniref:Glucose-1-phosphate adenylyltransferase n=1 Tax=candidate division CSSED10-310 bacterium TaxID=2855610 RepID=A0ABV6Z510_UNCC1
MKNCISVILGGGRGTRLFPLTKNRAKPAVPLGGKYRLIDVAISNCLHAGLEKIFVLTQFNSASLNRHIFRTYRFSEFSQGFIEILPAELSSDNTDWYQGTADAVRQNIKNFQFPSLENFVILGGDQLYRMDLRHLLRTHQRNGADISIAVIPVSAEKISRFGIVRIGQNKEIIDYREKPQAASSISDMVGDRSLLPEGMERPLPTPFYWASMGIYIMKKNVLEHLLLELKGDDFEKDIIPHALKNFQIYAFLFTGYWEDLGIISSFYRANLAMISNPAPINLYNNLTTVYTRHRHLPPSLAINTKIEGGLLAAGSKLINCNIKHSVVGIRCIIHSGAVIEDSILMGADYFDTEPKLTSPLDTYVPIGIGGGSIIRRAIIDKNVRMGQNVVIDNTNGVPHLDSDLYYIREGIIVIPKNTVIPDNFRIETHPDYIESQSPVTHS